MSAADEVGLAFGAIAVPIAEQLAKQGYELPGADADTFQRDADALTGPYLRNLLTIREVAAARRRLFKRISAAAVRR